LDQYVLVGVLFLAAALARRQLRFGRADRDGARRLAAFGAFWSVVGNGPLKDPRVLEPALLMMWVMLIVLVIVFFWLSYLALEPSVRRRWPDTLVSWTRLLRGRVLDPLVGRDVLLGVLGGTAIATLVQASNFADGTRWPASPVQLAGGWYALADRVVDCGLGVFLSLMTLMLLALLRQVLRRTWTAVAAVLLFFLGLDSLGGFDVASAVTDGLVTGIVLGLLIRPGLLAAVVALSVQGFLADTLMTTHLGEWYAVSAVSGILATLALAIWGFYASLGSESLFGDPDREAA
jgi:serine/threonine-protein kinase